MRPRKLNAIIQQAIDKDPVALEQLCELYAKPILIQTRLLVRNKNEAEDVSQRVIIEMLRDIEKLRSPYAFRGWLQRIIMNACFKQDMQSRTDLEHGDLLEVAEIIVDESLDARPEDYAIAADLRDYLGRFLGQLPTAQAIVLTLRYTEDLSYKEIATTLDVSLGTVSNTMSKAKKNLKALLKDKRDAGVLGIALGPLLLHDNLKSVVNGDVDLAVGEDAVANLISFAKLSIVGSTAGAKLVVATASTTKIALSIAVAVAVLGGTGITAYQLQNNNLTDGDLAPVAPEIIGPDSRVTYSVQGEQQVHDATNPQEAWLSLLTGESIQSWILTETISGNQMLTGTGNHLDIAALGLPEGDYTITWYVLNDQSIESRIFFDFFIRD
jgi:RNA polymerase sigma-70 factor (ECF subfamily)